MYKIVIDSCGELPEELKQDGHYETVSLELEVDGCRIKDDSTFNQLDFLRRVKESLKGPKSSCPSPEQYMDAYEGEADHVYAVTLSGGLSGSYNSAVLGKNLYEEEHGDTKKIYVFMDLMYSSTFSTTSSKPHPASSNSCIFMPMRVSPMDADLELNT